MPYQNRVTPEGEIIATPARGTFMGNRGGRIHDATRKLGRSRWASRQWIICVLCFKGRQRRVMGDSYTELFFLDEVTALAAGHRPCFECRRAAAKAYAAAFPGPARAPEIDRVLHAQRRAMERDHVEPAQLPDGAMFLYQGQSHAKRGAAALPWTVDGYAAAQPLPRTACTVLTPPATRTALSAGYAPVWHPDAPAPG